MGDEAPPPYAPFVPGQCSPERIRYLAWLRKQPEEKMTWKESFDFCFSVFNEQYAHGERIVVSPRKEKPRQFNWKAAVIGGVCTWLGIKFFE
ncbi:MAG: hypothetical protein LBG65_05150 [Puniceicoccales bacterium]|jgi:hypothetical protein|nr:hypothetical protein [Puniceicoccales bacterium]